MKPDFAIFGLIASVGMLGCEEQQPKHSSDGTALEPEEVGLEEMTRRRESLREECVKAEVVVRALEAELNDLKDQFAWLNEKIEDLEKEKEVVRADIDAAKQRLQAELPEPLPDRPIHETVRRLLKKIEAQESEIQELRNALRNDPSAPNESEPEQGPSD